MTTTMLTQGQMDRLHGASLDILSRTGVVIPHHAVLGMFDDVGAVVDHKSERVRIPESLVVDLTRQAGREFTLYGRDLTKSARFGAGKRNYNSSAGQALWVESLGGPRRYTRLTDVEVAARFADALEYITIPGAMSDPSEVPVSYRCVEVMASMLRSTTKPITFWFHDRDSARFIVEMMIALRGDEKRAAEFPICYPFLEPISPLRFPFDGIDLLFETSRVNLPVPVGPMAQMGLTAPATIAGTLAQENAEILAGVCITQLIRPGTPVCYGGVCHAHDMARTQVIFGGPEQAIFSVAMAQMGRYYGFPTYVNAGLTDSKLADAQAGVEVGITLALSASSGADIFGHLGIVGADQGASLEMLVMQHEMVSYIERIMRSIDMSDDALGLDVIDRVGPGGVFIDQEHTVEHFREELWFPQLMDRRFYQEWFDSGAASLAERCRERVEDVLRSHQPEPLEENISRAINEVLRAARRELSRELAPAQVYLNPIAEKEEK
jgi:trimethylamine---corrinoid protein Co-methyltransferase